MQRPQMSPKHHIYIQHLCILHLRRVLGILSGLPKKYLDRELELIEYTGCSLGMNCTRYVSWCHVPAS